MTMDVPIFEAGIKEISSGLFPGLNDLSLPLWKTGDKIDFRPDGAASSKGRERIQFDATLFDSHAGDFDDASGLFDAGGSSVPLILTSNENVIGVAAINRSDGTQMLFVGTYSKLYSFNGIVLGTSVSNFDGVKDAGGTGRCTQWSMVNVGDWQLASNGRQKVQIIKADTWEDLYQDVFDWAKIIRKFGPFILAINTSNGGKLVEWCADDDIEDWEPTADNTAGNLLLRELVSDPIAAEMLGSFLAVYTESQLLRLGYRPNAFVFGSDGVISGCGAVSNSSVVDIGGKHIGLMKQGIFTTDGFAVQWAEIPGFTQYLEETINWDQRSKIVGYHSPSTKQVRWSVPLAGSLDNSFEIAYNYVTGSLSTDTKAYYSSFPQDVFSYPILGINAGTVVYAQKGQSELGNTVSRTLQTKPMDFGARTEWKYVDYVQSEVKVRSGSGPQISIGWQERLTDPIVWTTPETVDPTLNQNFIRVSGVFLSFRWTSENADDDWVVSGFKVFGTVDGGTI